MCNYIPAYSISGRLGIMKGLIKCVEASDINRIPNAVLMALRNGGLANSRHLHLSCFKDFGFERWKSNDAAYSNFIPFWGFAAFARHVGTSVPVPTSISTHKIRHA